MQLVITDNLLTVLRKKGAASVELPHILLGKKYPTSIFIDKLIPLINISPTPKKEYIPEPTDFLQALNRTTLLNPESEDDFIGIFHNHPKGPAMPSTLDVLGSRWNGIYIIYSRENDNFNFFTVTNKTWTQSIYVSF